jgi:hypothetical protein
MMSGIPVCGLSDASTISTPAKEMPMMYAQRLFRWREIHNQRQGDDGYRKMDAMIRSLAIALDDIFDVIQRVGWMMAIVTVEREQQQAEDEGRFFTVLIDSKNPVFSVG